MYRKILLASVGAIALGGSAVLAADLSMTPSPPLPVFTWTGIYVGGQAGYAWGSGGFNYSGFDPFDGITFNSGASETFHGVIGGAHVGYNFQINQWVVGLQGSMDGTSLSNSVTTNLSAFTGSILSASANSSIQGSIRGRAGFAWDRALIYATGGVAFTSVHTSYAFIGNIDGNPLINGGSAFNSTSILSNTRTGWTVGGGVDYAVTDNWSVFAEYRYTDFGTISNPGLSAAGFISAPILTNAFLNVDRMLNQSQVEVGFSYKLGSYAPAPVVAKY
ncbi:MAG TPA: outer membrane protein [Methylocella sp.]|nr:outer membrane protein [Methylocella sp.]